MVSIMGIFITFVLGWQIINTLEIKNKFAELENVKTELKEQKEKLNETTIKSQHLVSYTWALDAIDSGEYAESFRYAVTSLLNSMQLTKPINIEALLTIMEDSTEEIPQGFLIKSVFYNLVIEEDKIIREFKDYVYVQERYEPCFDLYIKRVKPV